MPETQVQVLGQEDPWSWEWLPYPGIFAWRIPWTEELSKLQSIGSQRAALDWAANTFTQNAIISLKYTAKWLSKLVVSFYTPIYNVLEF